MSSIEERTPGAVATEPVGHEGARVSINEKNVWSLGAGPAAFALLAMIVLMIASGVFFAQSINALENDGGGALAVTGLIASIVVFTVALVVTITSVKVVSPGHTLTVQFFGRYIGTLRRTGLSFVPPLSVTKKVSVRVRNFETNEAKVNDYNGNPINIAAIIVWQVADTAQASFSVEDFSRPSPHCVTWQPSTPMTPQLMVVFPCVAPPMRSVKNSQMRWHNVRLLQVLKSSKPASLL